MPNKKSKKKDKRTYFKSYNSFLKTFSVKGPEKKTMSIGREKFDVDKDTKNTIDDISRKPSFAGRPLGTISEKGFLPSIDLIDRIHGQAYEDFKITLDKRSSWLFLCGRDIFYKSLPEDQKEKIKKGYILPMNEKEENLGIAFFDGKMIVNLIDKGDFLRREG